MMRILFVGGDQEFAGRLAALVPGGVWPILADPLPGSASELLGLLNGSPRPDLTVLDPGDDLAGGIALAQGLTRERVPVVMVTDRGDEIGLQALRAGVADVLEPECDDSQLKQSLERAWLRAASTPVPPPEQPALPRGQVVAVASPKGGVGKTTVATNLAVGLATRYPDQVVLVDLDVHFGDVASALNLTPDATLPDLTSGVAARDTMVLKSLLTRHESGLLVVPGSESPAAADAVSVAAANNLLAMLATQFAWVVVDTAPGLSEHTLAVLDHTDSLVLVTSLDVPGVRGLRKELDTLAALNLGLGSRHVVLNFFDRRRGLTVADVEATIKAPVDIVLPQSTDVPVSVNQGIPLLQGTARQPVARHLLELLDRIAPAGNTGRRPGRFTRRSEGATR